MADAPEYCATTREEFKELITKPPLTDKLLQKPPFRFLHDVITGSIKKTNFLEGIYTDEELDSGNIGDKDSKIAFLSKAVDAAQFALGQSIDIKLSKTVAGHEPEKTNDFLQKFARAAKTSSPEQSESIVKRVLAGEKPSNLNESGGSAGSNKENNSTKPAAKKEKRSSSKDKKSKEKEKPSDVKDKKREPSKEKKKSSSKDKERSSSKDKERSSSKDKEKSSSKDKVKRSSSSSRKPKDDSSKSPRPDKKSKHRSPKPSAEGDRNEVQVNGHDEELNSLDSPTEPDSSRKRGKSPKATRKQSPKSQPSSAEKERQKSPSPPPKISPQGSIEQEEPAPRAASRMTRSARPMTAAGAGARPGTSMGRPGTAARAAPPRLKRRELGEIEQPQRIDSASSQKETTNIITGDAAKNDAKEEEEAFIMEDDSPRVGDGFLGDDDDPVDAADINPSELGYLGRKILETKNDLERNLGSASPGRERGVRVEFDEKEREKTRREAAKLQDTVQSLTRSSHPLGRLVDYQQEDIDSMLKELEQWREEYKGNMTKLSRVQGSESESLEPARSKLAELEQQIREKRDAISAVRGSILDVETKLANLVQAIGR